jgi:hypothetical protein
LKIKIYFVFIVFVQACCAPAYAQADMWRSPTANMQSFPKLGIEDCARYGAKYNFAECAPYRPGPMQETALGGKTLPRKSAVIAKISRADKKRNLTIATQGFEANVSYTDGGCAKFMDRCYAQCKSHGIFSRSCNEVCTTDVVCKWKLAMDYGTFLNKQIEDMRSAPLKPQPRPANIKTLIANSLMMQQGSDVQREATHPQPR